MSESEWTVICQSTEEYSIQIKKLRLESSGIETRLFDQRDSSYNSFGYIYLHVKQVDAEKAKEILEQEDE